MTIPDPARPEHERPSQRLPSARGHMATLKRHAATEALSGVLDAARAEGLSVTAALERQLTLEVSQTEGRWLDSTRPADGQQLARRSLGGLENRRNRRLALDSPMFNQLSDRVQPVGPAWSQR